MCLHLRTWAMYSTLHPRQQLLSGQISHSRIQGRTLCSRSHYQVVVVRAPAIIHRHIAQNQTSWLHFLTSFFFVPLEENGYSWTQSFLQVNAQIHFSSTKEKALADWEQRDLLEQRRIVLLVWKMCRLNLSRHCSCCLLKEKVLVLYYEETPGHRNPN